MRWWPPVLHLSVMAAIAALAVLRIADAVNPAPPAPPGGAELAADRSGTDGGGRVMAEPSVQRLPVDPAALLARPVFVPDRRIGPAGEGDPAAAAIGDRDATIRMTGYVHDGQRPLAILSAGDGTPEAVVTEGAPFAGLTVLVIAKDVVELVGDGGKITVQSFAQ